MMKKTTPISASDDSRIPAFSPETAFERMICTADDALAWALREPVAVFRDVRCVSGQAVWDAFYSAVSAKQPASVLCAYFYELDRAHVSPELYEAEKDLYPQMFFSLVAYDGETFRLRSRISTDTVLDRDEPFLYLVHLIGENPPGALYRYTEEYDLVNAASVTWERLQRSMFSSQYGDFIRHASVYMDMHD